MSVHIGIGKETTPGTPVAPTVFFEAMSEDVQLEREFIRIKTIRSDVTRKVSEAFSLVRGSFTVIGNYQDIHWLFYAILGSSTVTGAGPYTHTAPATGGIAATLPSFTIEARRKDLDAMTWRYAGCKVVSLGLSVTLNQEARLVVGVLGWAETTGTAASETWPDLDVMLPKECTVNVDGTAVDAVSFNLNMNFPHDEPNVLGSSALTIEPEKNDVLEVTGDFEELTPDALTNYNKFDGSTDVDVALVADTGGDETLTINMNKTRVTQATPHNNERERLKGVFEFESYFDTTATANLQAVTTNDDATDIAA